MKSLQVSRACRHTGAPWRDLPPDYGGWKNTHRRFSRWRDRGVWEHLLDELGDQADLEWVMIDASHSSQGSRQLRTPISPNCKLRYLQFKTFCLRSKILRASIKL